MNASKLCNLKSSAIIKKHNKKFITKLKSLQSIVNLNIAISMAICFLALVGCASSTALKQGDRLSIQTVNVAENVELTEDMFYQGPKENLLGVTFGIFSLPYVEGSKAKTEDIIKAVMKKNKIDVCEIARSQFVNKLENVKIFNLASEGSDAEFRLSIPYYGLGQTHGLSSQLKPLIGVKGTLITNRNNKLVWEKYAYVTNLNSETPSRTLEEYLGDTKSLEQAFNLASSIVINELINDITGIK
jgi:hypothetical protein